MFLSDALKKQTNNVSSCVGILVLCSHAVIITSFHYLNTTSVKDTSDHTWLSIEKKKS